MIEVPLSSENPGQAAGWVRYCNLEKKYGVRFWTVGDEPDLDGGQGGTRTIRLTTTSTITGPYNALKTVDPSILVLGPELAWKYTEGRTTADPLLQYNGTS